ncbi:MAG: lipid II flippase MurJ [Candidatus Paceibacterota bacterium]
MVHKTLLSIRTRVRGLRQAAYSRISTPIQGLHQAAYLLAALTLASQALALLRDRTFAHTFGAGQVLDVYYAAFRVPDLVFAIVSSLVSAYVIIPRITGMDRAETRRLLSETATFLFVVGGLACVGIALFMPSFLTALYPDLMRAPGQEGFVLLARILLVQPLLLGLSGIFSSVTQVHRRFVLFALSPVLYNLGIIVGTVYFYPLWGLPGIGGGVILGAVAYLMVNVPVLLEAGVLPALRMPRLALMLPIVRDSVPRSLALGMNSITALALTAMASRIGTGSVSVFTLAGNLQAVPLALIGSSYAVAAFPALSEASALEDKGEFTRVLSSSARHIILWSIIALGMIIVLRAHLVRVILGTGAFDWEATRLTAALLVVLAVGLAAEALKLLFSRALYAARQSWRPLMYQLAAGALTVLLAIKLLGQPPAAILTPLAALLKVSDVSGLPILLLALASTLGQIFLLMLSLVALRTVAPGLSRALLRPCVDGIIAAVAGATAAYSALALMGSIAPLTTLATVLAEGLTAGVAGLIVVGLVLHALGNKEFAMIVDLFRTWRRSPEGASGILEPSAEEPPQP